LGIVGKSRWAAGLAIAYSLIGVAPATADDWLPHPADAKWQYLWADTSYNPQGTIENVVVQKTAGNGFTLGWADTADQPPASDQTSISCPPSLEEPDIGTVSFHDSNLGLINVDWNSCPPPFDMPILCPDAAGCANSLASALYNVIWANRVPVLSEPLLQGTSFSSTGGARNDVSSTSQYLGLERIKVRAFPAPVMAAAVRSTIVQAGALGDPYGSGVRTTWWLRGVGPIRIVFQHDGGAYAPVTNVELLSTNQTPLPVVDDQDYFPLRQGLMGKFQWTNSRYLRQAEVERFSVDAAANRTARLTVRSLAGPMKVAGSYGFTLRLDGVSSLSGFAQAATLVKLPKLGHGRHFLTPFDMMSYGFNPVIQAYPSVGATWTSGSKRDFATYGVTGATKVVGVQKVHVPAGTFSALVVRSVLTQKGYPYGSGVRTMWFAPGRGLVKLLFRHGDRSVSLVQLIK
jgi:hypothetical protein